MVSGAELAVYVIEVNKTLSHGIFTVLNGEGKSCATLKVTAYANEVAAVACRTVNGERISVVATEAYVKRCEVIGVGINEGLSQESTAGLGGDNVDATAGRTGIIYKEVVGCGGIESVTCKVDDYVRNLSDSAVRRVLVASLS